ncbi:hypothetical protein ACFLWG_03130 [Chloroflexota bacterium]
MTKQKYSYFFEDVEPGGSEEHRKFFAKKEDKRLEFMTAALIEKYGPEAQELIDEAMQEMLSKREGRCIEIFSEMLREKYGDEVNDLIEKAIGRAILEREPKNIRALGLKFAEKYGPEAITQMMEGNRRMWKERSEELIKEYGITEKNAIGAARILAFVHRMQGSVVEATPQRAVREECFCVMLPYFGPEWCIHTITASCRGMADAVNPKIQVKFEKMLAWGDSCCRIAFELPEETEDK